MEESYENDILGADYYEEDLVTSDYSYDGLTGESYEVDNSYDDSYDYDDEAAAVGLSIFAGLLGVIILIALVCYTVKVVAQWKIYEKANKPGWAALIPYYNKWVLYEMVNMPGWIALVGLVPVLGSIAALIAEIMAFVRLSKAFGKETAFSIGLIFLPLIFLPILGFDKSTYLGEEAAGEKLFK